MHEAHGLPAGKKPVIDALPAVAHLTLRTLPELWFKGRDSLRDQAEGRVRRGKPPPRRARTTRGKSAMPDKMQALVVMGVSGCGKTSVAEALSERMHARMIEGDAFHPRSNVEKMTAGTPLTDADRQGWLESLGRELAGAVDADDRVVLTCSALKLCYRDTLRAASPGLGFVFLQLSREAAAERVARRSGHYMPASLVESQFRDLEPPVREPRVLTVDATGSLHAIVDSISTWWQA